MFAMAATNVVGVILFGTLYAAAGARWLPQPAFMACLILLFALVTAVWIGVERRQGAGRGGLARIGRIVFGVLVVVVGVPSVVLMPLFWLDSRLPREAGVNPLLAPMMSIVLIALGLTVLVNVIGGVYAAARGTLLLLLRRR
jgi:hypothetical protein